MPPEPTADDADAMAAWRYLSTGAGGIEWSGLPFVIAHLGIADVQGLMDRLLTIKAWATKPRGRDGTGSTVD